MQSVFFVIFNIGNYLHQFAIQYCIFQTVIYCVVIVKSEKVCLK